MIDYDYARKKLETLLDTLTNHMKPYTPNGNVDYSLGWLMIRDDVLKQVTGVLAAVNDDEREAAFVKLNKDKHPPVRFDENWTPEEKAENKTLYPPGAKWQGRKRAPEPTMVDGVKIIDVD